MLKFLGKLSKRNYMNWKNKKFADSNAVVYDNIYHKSKENSDSQNNI